MTESGDVVALPLSLTVAVVGLMLRGGALTRSLITKIANKFVRWTVR